MLLTLLIIDWLATVVPTHIKPSNTAWWYAPGICVVVTDGRTPNLIRDDADWCAVQR